MPHILLATYNFYPYNWGGSEVYVAGLAAYLSDHHHQVSVIAAVPDAAFDDHGTYWSGECLRICQYEYAGINIYGVQHDLNTLDIYQKYRPEWEKDWIAFFAFLKSETSWIPGLLHLHGFTAVIGIALVKAFNHTYTAAPIHASYHTPISCPQGTLLRWGKAECRIRANVADCSACTWQAKTQWPIWAAQAAVAVLPKQLFAQAPTAIQWKALIAGSISSFQELLGLIQHWWVFSEQIQQVLLAQGVAASVIQMGRHGVAPQFVAHPAAERAPSPLIFAFVGRFVAIKGLYTLLKAWQLLPNTPERQLWLIGDESEADPTIRTLLGDMKNRQDVLLLGKKSPAELEGYYQQIHALVVPSEWIEIGPIVVHEAVAVGTQVIASDIGGTRELAQYYPEVCRLFPVGNASSLSQVIANFVYKRAALNVETQATHYAKILNWYATQG